MLLAKVVGTVIATRKEPEIEGLKMLICRAFDVEAVDTE